MNLFENLQIYYEDKSPMLEMARLNAEYADKTICGEIPLFIYFSPCQSGHSPRVKFYGGTKQTSTTRTAPSMSFDKDGAGKIILEKWMDKKICPNAYDKEVINQVATFVNKFKSILLLTWFEKVDEAQPLRYFEGRMSWRDLLDRVEIEEETIKKEFIKCNGVHTLHEFCIKHDLYEF